MEIEFSHEMFTNFTNFTWTERKLNAIESMNEEKNEDTFNLSTIFNTSNTNITIIPNYLRSIDEKYDASKLGLTWLPIYFKNKTMRIFMKIHDPPEISALREGPDSIELSFFNSSD